MKCKTKTETNSTIQSKSKNNRDIVKGVCSVCGMNKSIFVTTLRPPTGKGFSLNNLINNLPIEFHQFVETVDIIFRGVLSTTRNNFHIVDLAQDMIKK